MNNGFGGGQLAGFQHRRAVAREAPERDLEIGSRRRVVKRFLPELGALTGPKVLRWLFYNLCCGTFFLEVEISLEGCLR